MNKIRVRFLMFAVVVVTAIYSTVANTLGTLSQRELDLLVENEALRIIHGQDWISWVNYCKSRGATDDMFVEAFSKIAQRKMGAEQGSDEVYKCMKAVSAINEFSVAASNLTTVVQVAKNAKSPRVRSVAVKTYYKLTKGTNAYLDFAEGILLSGNLQPEVELWVMTGLWHDARDNQNKNGAWGRRVATLMRHYVAQDVRGLDSADQILKWTDATYATSQLRRNIRKRILAPEFRDVINKFRGRSDEGQRIQMLYSREESQEGMK